VNLTVHLLIQRANLNSSQECATHSCVCSHTPSQQRPPKMQSCSCRHVQTLVLDLDDLLVHSHWTRGRGWRTFKRPGVEDFIKHMGQFYEIVVFTDQASPLIYWPTALAATNGCKPPGSSPSSFRSHVGLGRCGIGVSLRGCRPNICLALSLHPLQWRLTPKTRVMVLASLLALAR